MSATYTATAAGEKLGISRQRVIELALARNVGKRPVKGVWLFSEDDLVALRDPALGRPPGRPRKSPA